MNDVGATELKIVLAVMLVLLLFAFAAIGVFIRVWRKERAQKEDS